MTTHTHEEHVHEVEHTGEQKALFGFWAYIMSDCLLFACLFASFAVLRTSTFGGPSGKELFSMPFVLTETIILLTSSFTYGLVTLYAHHRNDKDKAMLFLFITFVLGALFVAMEVGEFSKLWAEGNGPDKSAFLSSFFALVGTHGLHVTAGLLWMGNVFMQVWRKGVNSFTLPKLTTLGLFWHFLDLIWIFIFTIVYLLSAIY